jgi:hypothetical protein
MYLSPSRKEYTSIWNKKSRKNITLTRLDATAKSLDLLCYTCDPAREARMEQRIHEGILYQDQHKRYCLYEPGVPEHGTLTCTSGCRLEVWLNRTGIAGHVEGDGEDYWFFADGGGRFLLAC